ncbi:MAG: glycoside hydrolase family protein [Oceanipulchritudo sp.]
MSGCDAVLHLGPASGKGGFADDHYWIWCASPVIGDDGKYHLFASRIPRTIPFHPGWLFASEIVRAEAELPEGPYRFREVVLGARDPAFFDGRSAHNPCIRKVGTKYLLFYMGSTYPGKEVDVNRVESGGPLYKESWARKRIGLAWADSVHGPWNRPDKPLLEPRPGHWDAIATTNPAPWILPDGSVRMIYKSRTVADGPRLLGLAGAPTWQGPYAALMEHPLFPGVDLEDACLWHDGERFRMILKDMAGTVGGEPGCLVQAWSQDAVAWIFPDPPILHGKLIRWDDGSTEQLGNFERPQLLFDAHNRPTHLFAAVSRGGSGIGDAAETFSVCLPVRSR